MPFGARGAVRIDQERTERLHRLYLVGPGMELVDLAGRGAQDGSPLNDLDAVRWSRTIGALGDVDRPRAVAFLLDFAGLIEAARPWVDFAAREAIRQKMHAGDDSSASLGVSA